MPSMRTGRFTCSTGAWWRRLRSPTRRRFDARAIHRLKPVPQGRKTNTGKNACTTGDTMKRRFAWETVFAIVVIAIGIHIPLEAALTEELHKTYSLQADGRISLSNVNGAVHVTAWDRNEVQVDAVKSATTKEILDEAQIVIDAAAGSVSIRTRYPEHQDRHEHAKVEYTVKAPRGARLAAVSVVNGPVDVEGFSSDVKVSSVNGRVTAKNLAGGEARISTVNGPLDASFDKI